MIGLKRKDTEELLQFCRNKKSFGIFASPENNEDTQELIQVISKNYSVNGQRWNFTPCLYKDKKSINNSNNLL